MGLGGTYLLSLYTNMPPLPSLLFGIKKCRFTEQRLKKKIRIKTLYPQNKIN